jgi:hypothetical protein
LRCRGIAGPGTGLRMSGWKDSWAVGHCLRWPVAGWSWPAGPGRRSRLAGCGWSVAGPAGGLVPAADWQWLAWHAGHEQAGSGRSRLRSAASWPGRAGSWWMGWVGRLPLAGRSAAICQTRAGLPRLIG